MSTSHDWARSLQNIATFMLSKPEVEMGKIPATRYYQYSDKEGFIQLVRAFKPGKKMTGNYDVTFVPTGTENFEIAINRDLVCEKITPEYRCQPLLSSEEDAEMEQA